MLGGPSLPLPGAVMPHPGHRAAPSLLSPKATTGGATREGSGVLKKIQTCKMHFIFIK